MKHLLTVIILLCTVAAQAQLRPVYGRVSDEHGSPIAYAVVQIKDRNNGTYTGEDGIFYIEVDPVANARIFVSCVGYDRQEVILPTSTYDSVIVVLKGNLTIPEVSVVAKQGSLKLVRLGKENLEYRGQVYFNIGDEMAIFLPADQEGKSGYLKDVSIYVTSIGKEDSKIRLHVYDVDPVTKMPLNDITGNNIVVNATEGNSWLNVGLAKYKIPVTDEGVYIGIEWISGYGNDPKERWRRGLFTYHSPVIGFTQSYGGRHRRYCRLGFSPTWRDGEYKKYRLSPMVHGTYMYRDYN